MAISHNSKCRYGERGAADAKPKAQIILDAAKVSAASGGNSEPKQGQRSQSARGFCSRSTMRVPQPDIIEHFGNADAVPQLPERCLSRKAGIVRCCLKNSWNPQRIPAALCLKSCLCLRNIRHFLCFQIYLKKGYIPQVYLNRIYPYIVMRIEYLVKFTAWRALLWAKSRSTAPRPQ